MAAKPPDIRKVFAAHLDASLKRDECARKGLEYEKAGDVRKAREALRQAERWDFKRRSLEL